MVSKSSVVFELVVVFAELHIHLFRELPSLTLQGDKRPQNPVKPST